MKKILIDFGLFAIALIMVFQIALFGLLALCLDNYVLGAITGVCVSELPHTLKQMNINR